MKLFKSLFLLVALALSTNSIFSQAVMNKSDFPLKAEFLSEGYVHSEIELAAPDTGMNQVWDLSYITEADIFSNQYYDATEDEFYADAISYKPTGYSLDNFLIDSKDFYIIDDQGYAKIGRRITEVDYSITALTGGPNDNLKIVGGNSPFEGRLDYLQFPLEYGNSWTQSHYIPTNYELTVEAYGLNNAPGVFIQHQTQTRTVVGDGELTIPQENNNITVDALLIKVEITTIDSVFLNNQPAPPQLMAAFGLEQGASVSEVTYVFYAPGYGESVASYDMDDEYITYQSLSKDISSIETKDELSLNVYPNPIKAGTKLNISNSDANISKLVLIDQTGRMVLEQKMSTSLSVPNTISTGAYLLNSYDDSGNLLNSKKIIVE